MNLKWNMSKTVRPILDLNNTGEFGLDGVETPYLNIVNKKYATLNPYKKSNPLIATSQLYESGHMSVDVNVEHICQLKGLTTILLIMITSALSHERQRMAIRQTWGHYAARRDIGIAFVLGRSLNKTENKAISWENYVYGDLIRGNFIDTYKNLTLKTISILEWTDLNCYRAKYVLKTDDDVFINVPKLFNFVEEQLQQNVKRTIFGRVATNWPPVRNKKSKYYVSPEQYQGVYPRFTTGPAYLMTADIVHDLYESSLKTVYLKLEDVFITGIVAESLDIKRVQINEFTNRRTNLNRQSIRNSISIHMISCSEQFDVWQKQQT